MFGKSDPYCLISKFEGGRVAGGNYNEGRNGKTKTMSTKPYPNCTVRSSLPLEHLTMLPHSHTCPREHTAVLFHRRRVCQCPQPLQLTFTTTPHQPSTTTHPPESNLSPIWNETHAFLIESGVSAFTIMINDEDLGKDDTMASVHVVINTKDKDETVQLKKDKDKRQKVVKRGTLHFSYKTLTFDEILANVDQLPPDGNSGWAGNWDRLCIPVIHDGSDLKNTDIMSKSDPYCVVKFDGAVTGGSKGGGTMDQTRTISKDLNPKWEEQFAFMLSPQARHATFTVYDEDMMGRDTMGGATIQITGAFGCVLGGLLCMVLEYR